MDIGVILQPLEQLLGIIRSDHMIIKLRDRPIVGVLTIAWVVLNVNTVALGIILLKLSLTVL
jgi:hypothetical protein